MVKFSVIYGGRNETMLEDVDEPYEVSARTEPYFWVPVAVTTYGDDRLLVLETARHRFQIFEIV